MTVPLHEITVEPGDELFTGTSTAPGVDDGLLPVSLDGRSFLLDTSAGAPARHSRRNVELLNTQQADSGDDQAALQPEVWRRNIESWHQGAGQLRYDRRDGLPYRYATSAGVDVWDQYRLKLLNEVTNIRTLPAGRPHLLTVGPERLFAAVGTQAYWWTDIDVAPTAETLPAAVVDACTDGQNLYYVDATGLIRKATAPGAWTSFGTIPSFIPARGLLRYVKGFLVAASGNVLHDMSGGVPRLIFTHPLEGFTWLDTCEGLAPAYLLGGMGDKWHVYAMTINDEATSFDPPVAAAPIPEGEIGYTIASYLGYVLIGSNAGWRFAIPSGDGTLSFGRLVETAAPVQCFEGQDRFVWFGQSTDVTQGNVAGLGRADLATFVGPLTPASAADLATTVTGAVRAVTTYGAGPARAGRRLFAVQDVGVFAEQDTLVASGYLEQGVMSFNSSNPKMALYGQLFCEPLEGGTIALDAKYDQGVFTEVGKQDIAAQVSMGNVPLERSFYTTELRVRLTRDPANHEVGPVVTRLEFRAMNIPGQATEFTLPIMLRENMEWEGVPVSRDILTDYQHLMDLVTSRRSFPYREAGVSYQLHATDFLWLTEQLTEKGDTYQGLFILTAKEIR